MKPEELRRLQAEIEKKYESAPPEELKKLVAKAYSSLKEANEFFEKLTSQPLHTGIVLNNPEKDSVDVVSNGKIMNVKINPDIEEKDLAPGTSVNLLQESGAVFGIREPIGSNILAYVEEVLPDGNVVVDVGGRKQALMSIVPVKAGERVAVDSSLNVVLKSYGKQTKLYSLEKISPVPWERIGGLEKAIREIREAIEDPFVHAKIHRKYGSIPPKGILLYGPPGCGKTLIAKAIAYNLSQRLAKQGKANGNGNFFSIKGPELKNPYYGTSESLIRMLFTNARESAEHTGDLSMIFIDEAESLFGRRGQALKHIDDSGYIPNSN